MRRSMFGAVLNSAPTILSRASKSVRDGVMKILTETPDSKWLDPTALEKSTYAVFHDFLKGNLDGRYTEVLNIIIPNVFQTAKQLQLYGKWFGSVYTNPNPSILQMRNSLIEYQDQGQKKIGKIHHFFRTSKIASTFVLIEPFLTLNFEDQAKNLYQNYPRLHATVVYDRLGPPVVVDLLDLCGHVALVKNKENAFGIHDPTLAVVSLRNLVSDLPIKIVWSVLTNRYDINYPPSRAALPKIFESYTSGGQVLEEWHQKVYRISTTLPWCIF